MAVRSGALNLYHKNSLKEQVADIEQALGKWDIVSLSEVRGNDIKRWAKANGYGIHQGPDDTAILFNPDVIRMVPGTAGAEKLNNKTGPRGAARSRSAAYAQFELVSNGKKFWQISAHTVPRGKKGMSKLRKEIQQEQFQSLSALAKRLDGPVLVAGDLNNVDPNAIKGMESGHDGGIMHVLGSGASTVNLDKIANDKLNSDHAAVGSSYRLDGGGNDKIDLESVDRMGKAQGGGSRPGGSGGKKSDKQSADGSGDAKDWAADYGWSYAFLKDHPNLKDIFDKAIENNWSPQRFIAEVQDTPWFKKHSDTWRQASYLQATDPQTYDQRVQKIRAHINDSAGALGIEVSDKLLDKWSEQALRFGWDEGQINNHLASQVKVMGKHSTVGGELASTQDALNRWSLENGVKINRPTMQKWLRQIVRGGSTMEEFKSYITKQAIAAHPNWAKELQAGMTVADIAEPYRNMAAQMLEVSPDEININGKLLRSALSHKKDDGTYDSMPLYDFEDMLRQDPRWQKTDQAKQQYMETGSAILKMFGLST